MDKYIIRRRVRDFRDDHDFIFGILKSFFTMVIICVCAIIALLPIYLCLAVNGWWILSAFIIWPVGINSVAWITDCFDV